MTKFIIFLMLISSTLFAGVSQTFDTPVMTTESPQDNRVIDHKKSHWLTSFGFESMKYKTENDFDGVKSNFKPNEQEFWGGRIGVGGQIYLGAGLITTSKIEGYYMGTLFSRVLNGGAQDANVKFAYTKKTGQIYGADASQSLGFIFNMKTRNPFMDEWTYLTVEPYVEAGIGAARAYNRTNYSYALESTNEIYRLKVEDELVNAKLAVGVNFTSNKGYFLYLKATQNRYDVTSRKASKLLKNNDSATPVASEPTLSDKIAPIMIYALGGGYKF